MQVEKNKQRKKEMIHAFVTTGYKVKQQFLVIVCLIFNSNFFYLGISIQPQ